MMTCNIDWNGRHLRDVSELQFGDKIANKGLVTVS